ncbi:MAG: outer membrane protein assembly factor BamA [Candidatus Zixiibacteriota bacterium]|nr:MAG: outer membrane protein assembly factor BamA [candidate division Zixibacteria bacterium]
MAGSMAQAQSQSFNVVDIKIEGNRQATSNLILSVVGIKKGDDLTATVTQDALRRLYGLGFFKDIEILAEEVTGGLNIIIKVTELPKLRNLIFEGNKEIKSGKLKDELGLTTSHYLSNNLVFEKKNKIIDLYGEKGYFMADVKYELKYNDDSTQADLIYKINEGSKVKVEKVFLTGNVRVKADDIIGKMRNRKRGFLKSSNFDKEKYPEDKDKIIEYLHQQGYIDAYLKSDSIAVDSASNKMSIYLDIYEGPRYYFGKTTFSGNEVLPANILEKALKYREGEIFDNEKFDESFYELYFLYQEKGHLHVRLIDDRKTRDTLIDINFDIAEGLPSEVNLVRIIGNTRTKEKVIRREMTLRPGQVFHRSLLLRSIRDIMQLNYFGNVTPDIIDLPSGDVNLTVTVEEKPTAQVSAGAGYSGADKFVGTFGLGIPNFRGMGQQLSMNVDIGSERNSYSVSFTEPWAFGTPTLLGGEIYYTNRVWYDDYTEGSRGGSIRVGRRLSWPDNYFRAYVSYRLEDNRFYDFSDDYRLAYSNRTEIQIEYDSVVVDEIVTIKDSLIILGDPLPGSLERYNEDWFSASTMQFSLIRDSRDLPEFATRGSILSYSFEKSGSFLGGFWNYDKHIISLSKFIPIIGNVALAGKVTYGVVTASDDSTILISERFTPGGTGYTGIVRGYDDGSLTPDTTVIRFDTTKYYSTADISGDPDSIMVDTIGYLSTVRGKYMLVGNLELQVPILTNHLYLLGFFDIGNSWLYRKDINLDDLYKGVGVGFRLVVPGIGTLGFDFGYALDEQINPYTGDVIQEKGWKPHFQIGTTFR